MRRTAALLIALSLALGAAGCGDDADDDVATDDPSATEPSATEPGGFNDPLLDRELTVTEATGHEIVAGTTITLSFDGTTVTADAGCNHLDGTYTWDGDDLVVEALGGTEMACDPERMEQDAWISGFLAEGPTVLAAEDGAVTLTAGDEVVTLSDAPTVEALPLVGTTWTLDTLTSGVGPDDTAMSVPAGVTASITFADDGTYDLAAGCNTGQGTWVEAGAGTVQLDDPSLTRRRCDEDAMGVEEKVLDVIDGGERAFSIEGDRLTATYPDGPTLVFTASS